MCISRGGQVKISTQGLLAVSVLVASTLLSAAAIVAVSTRKPPPGTMPAGMKRSPLVSPG